MDGALARQGNSSQDPLSTGALQTTQEPREKIKVEIMDEIVGYTTVKSFKYRSADEGGVILWQVPLYKVRVSGQDDEGRQVSRDFKAVRFGVQRNSTGDPFIIGITSGTFNLSASSYMGGSYHIDGAMRNDIAYIHKGNPGAVSHASYIGCVDISGPGSSGAFTNFMTQLGFAGVGANVIFHTAATPPLVDSGHRWVP